MSDRRHRPWLSADRVAAPLPERHPEPEHAWDRAFSALFGAWRRGWIDPDRRALGLVWRTRLAGRRLRQLSDDDLRTAATELSPRLIRCGFTRDVTARAFALIIEATFRTRGYRHHDVQIVGGDLLLRGHMLEMATGEGKSLTALLPAGVAALARVPVHIITVNDYLAERDAADAAAILGRLGVSVAAIVGGQDPPVRASCYAADIVYGSSKEIAFDYLRDRIAFREAPSPARLLGRLLTHTTTLHEPWLMRGLHFAIVDEADSVLIDEARTPLLIARAIDEAANLPLYTLAMEAAWALTSGRDYTLDLVRRRADLTEAGRAALAARTDAIAGFWAVQRAREELVGQALSAIHLFHREQHYLVAEGKVQIVDEPTGRLMPDRQWERGLQQLIELKEGVPLSDRREVLARITYKDFIGRYLWCGGMSGTIGDAAHELRSIYALDVVRLPTHRAVRRVDRGVRLYRHGPDKWEAVARRAMAIARRGRPVLIGTRTVGASETLSACLTRLGAAHQVLNARQDKDEAGVVAQAGEAGRITVATAMAGRGTDIKLPPTVRSVGGLHVILTEFHESRRIDRQLFGRAGRQGDPGSCEAIVALDDPLFREACPGMSRALGLVALPFRRRMPGWIAKVLRTLAQSRLEAAGRLARRQTIAASREVEKMLAFGQRAE
jgi:preprotein translocase subunit SecA